MIFIYDRDYNVLHIWNYDSENAEPFFGNNQIHNIYVGYWGAIYENYDYWI